MSSAKRKARSGFRLRQIQRERWQVFSARPPFEIQPPPIQGSLSLCSVRVSGCGIQQYQGYESRFLCQPCRISAGHSRKPVAAPLSATRYSSPASLRAWSRGVSNFEDGLGAGERPFTPGLVQGFDPNWKQSIAPNITQDRDKGIGAGSDEEIKRAITQGISRDGHQLKPHMAVAAASRARQNANISPICWRSFCHCFADRRRSLYGLVASGSSSH
jgi:hypothetical protein